MINSKSTIHNSTNGRKIWPDQVCREKPWVGLVLPCGRAAAAPGIRRTGSWVSVSARSADNSAAFRPSPPPMWATTVQNCRRRKCYYFWLAREEWIFWRIFDLFGLVWGEGSRSAGRRGCLELCHRDCRPFWLGTGYLPTLTDRSIYILYRVYIYLKRRYNVQQSISKANCNKAHLIKSIIYITSDHRKAFFLPWNRFSYLTVGR